MGDAREYREIAAMACQQEADLSAEGSGRKIVFQRAAQMIRDLEAMESELAEARGGERVQADRADANWMALQSAEAEVERLREDKTELLKNLSTIEYVEFPNTYGSSDHDCPVCGGTKPHHDPPDPGWDEGHREDCWIGRALHSPYESR